MKINYLFILLFVIGFGFTMSAQKYGSTPALKFGKTLNLGAGLGYGDYVGYAAPIIMLNMEFDIARNVTLAPFIGFYTYSNTYYWGNPNYPYRYYSYRETGVPLGVKGVYYFDELLHANPKWNFYAGASLGLAFHKRVWDEGYYGDKTIVHAESPFYASAHVGARYLFTTKFGLYLDLSTTFSTFGLSFRL
ncbi:MAG: hypothetical protein PSX36_04590 [bacterium]|nr:hypothetical protein [bacterium]